MIDVLSFPDPDRTGPPSPTSLEQARRFEATGREALDLGDLDAAELAFGAAIEAAPALGTAWFNLGLVLKRRRRWHEVVVCNRHSLALGAAEQDPAWWNLGIAATALSDWPTARTAWAGYGIEIDRGDGPIEMDFGPAPVRLDPDGSAEVVWGQRIDPARIRIENVPLPGSGHRWGDVVLHDGEPTGERTAWGRTHLVFDALERWSRATTPTWECLLSGGDGLGDLGERFAAAGGACEDWTTGVRALCGACSEGAVGPHHHGPFPAESDTIHLGVAAAYPVAVSLLDAWVAAQPGRTRTDLLPLDS